jgi:hypothetical protein
VETGTPFDTFRQDASGRRDRVDEDLGIGPRDPYPQGNPPDEREVYHSIHGVYKEDKDARNTTG